MTSTNKISLYSYFSQWMQTYKEPFIAKTTYVKYQNNLSHIKEYFSDELLCDITRSHYQQTLNKFAKTHAKKTTNCFHKQIHASMMDAIEEQIIYVDFTRKAIITGREKAETKLHFLSYSEWKKLINHLPRSISYGNTNHLIIYLAAVTGLRFAEILGLTWADIDFLSSKLTINKTWDYKYKTGFKKTKNKSSNRVIDIDQKTIELLLHFKGVQEKWGIHNPDNLICMSCREKVVVSAQINRTLIKICEELQISVITFHGLRHTHASILLFQGVNIMAVSKRLGHADVSTTQDVYLHIIKEMEERETELILSILEKSMEE